MANILPFDKQLMAISALTEGCSIRAVERLTGIHRDTIMRLGARVGEGCARLHDAMMRDLQVALIGFDEIWAFVGKKQRQAGGDREAGDQYTFTAPYVERSNLTLRMQQRRFTRLTSGFSKKLDNHRAAVSLYVAHYNLCRVHETLRITPAMALGVADHI